MKKIILFPTLFFFAFSSFSQSGANLEISHGQYLLKSKKQNKTGLILLVGGAVFVATALIIPKGDPTGELSVPYFQDEFENDGVKASFGVAGVVAMLTSVPFLLSARKNKKRASKTAVSFHNQKIDYLRQNVFVMGLQPTLSFKLRL